MSAAPALPGVFHSLEPLLNSYGYLAVGGLLFLEDFGIPVPGETILIAAAVYAGAGRLNIAVVFVVGVLAAVLGDNLGYLIGRYAGQPAVHKYGRYVLLTPQRLAATEAFFARHGGKVITFARFLPGLRQANGIVAGLSRMHWLQFVGFNALGGLLWVGTWSAVGYLAGTQIQPLYAAISRFGLLAAAVVAVVGVGLLIRKRRAASRASR